MSFKFVTVSRAIYSTGSLGLMFIARIFRMGTVKPDEAISRISKHSQVSKASVVGVLEALEEMVAEAAQDGVAVKLPYLGMFIPAFKAKAQQTPNQVDTHTISNYTMRFFPSSTLKTAIKEAAPEKFNINVSGLQPSQEFISNEEYLRLTKDVMEVDVAEEDI